MKKQLLFFILSLVLVGVLATLLFLMQGRFLSYNGQQAPSAHRLALLELAPAQIDTISISTPHQSFELTNLGDHLCIKGWEQVPLSPQHCQNLMQTLTSLTATSFLGHTSSLSPSLLLLYGLDFPRYIIQISSVTASKITMEVGCSYQDNTYLSIDGSVFLVPTSALSPLLADKNSLVSLSVTPPLSPHAQTGCLRLGGTVRPQILTLHFSPLKNRPSPTPSVHAAAFPFSSFHYSLSSPKQADLPADSARPVLSSLYGLVADRVVLVQPSAAQLHQLGLSAPWATAYATVDGESFLLSASAPQADGTVYLMNHSLPVVFAAKVQNLPWLTAQYQVLAQASFFPPTTEGIQQIKITTPTLSYAFNLWKGQTTCNGLLIPEHKFQKLYREVLSLAPCSYVEAPPPQKEPLVSVSVSYTNPSRAPDILSLFPYSATEVLLTFNGETRFLAPRSAALSIVEQSAKFG